MPLSSFGLVDKPGSRGCVGRLATTPKVSFSRLLAWRNNSLHLSGSVHRTRPPHITRTSNDVREGYFSVLCLMPPDDPAGQQPMRTRSKPHGLDGSSPRDTQIVRCVNQRAELMAKFAQEALLCTVHKVATILIASEALDGHPSNRTTFTLDDDGASNPGRPG